MSFGQATLPGIAEGDVRLEEAYRQGGILAPEPETWRRLEGIDRVNLEERPPKIVAGRQAIPELEERRQQRLRQLQHSLAIEVDPTTRVRLDRELYCLSAEYWWRDEQGYLYMILPSTQEIEAHWRQARRVSARILLEYWAVRAMWLVGKYFLNLG